MLDLRKELIVVDDASTDGTRAYIKRAMALDLQVATADARAIRPAYSVLDHANLRVLGLDNHRDWGDALAAYLAECARSWSSF